VSVFDGRLRVEADRGLVTPAIREALVGHKDSLLQLLAFAKEYRDLCNTQARLIDELGPELAAAIREVERQDAALGSDHRA
jgi:tubulysin polyketide synthase-like protein